MEVGDKLQRDCDWTVFNPDQRIPNLWLQRVQIKAHVSITPMDQWEPLIFSAFSSDRVNCPIIHLLTAQNLLSAEQGCFLIYSTSCEQHPPSFLCTLATPSSSLPAGWQEKLSAGETAALWVHLCSCEEMPSGWWVAVLLLPAVSQAQSGDGDTDVGEKIIQTLFNTWLKSIGQEHVI